MSYDIAKEEKPILSQAVNNVQTGYDRAKSYHQPNINNCSENWRFYWAKFPELGQGQWSNAEVLSMANDGRKLLQYNVIKPLVDTLAGSLLQQPFDPDFIPIDSEVTSLTEVIEKAMYSDKELLDWNASYKDVITHGLIHEGVMKMVISNEYNELGNIGFETCLPNSVIFDPNWKTWRSKDCKKCWKESWLTAKEIADLYPEVADKIAMQIGVEIREGETYGQFTGIIPYSSASDKWGDSYKVIEEYNMIDIKTTREYVITAESETLIPEMDDLSKPEWLNENVPDWTEDAVFEKPYIERKCTYRAICPTLLNSCLLAEGFTEVQCGRLPFFLWSASRENGESQSIVDSLKDAQINLNQMEAMGLHKIKTEGSGGSQFYDRDKFVDEAEADRYCNHRNNPKENFAVRPGELDNGAVAVPTNKSGFPSEIYKQIDGIINVVIPNISKLNPATLGKTQVANESGKLFGMVKIQADQAIYTIHYGLRMFWNDVYEAYLIQAAQTYSNESVERTFTLNGGKESITLNERIITQDGRDAIRNDASELRNIRHKVIISEKASSPTQKIANVEMITSALQAIPENRIATRNKLTSKMFENLDILAEEDLAEFEAIAQKELERDMATIEAETANAKLATATAQAQLAQMQQPQQAQIPLGQATVDPNGQPIQEAPQGNPQEAPQGNNINPQSQVGG